MTGMLLLAMGLPFIIYRYVSFKPSFNAAEQAVARFAPAAQPMPQRTWQYAATAPNPLGESFSRPPAAATQQKRAVSAASSAVEPLPAVTFILQGNGRGMAIIDGTVVREGEKLRSWKVTRIERNRVLLEGRKGSRWVTLQ